MRIVKGNAPPPNTVANAPELQPGDDIPHDAENDNKGTVAARPQRQAPPRDVLPPAARAKLLALQGQAEDARDAANSAARRMFELRKGLAYGEEDPEHLRTIDMELTRLDRQRSAQDHKHRELAALTTNINDWLRSLRNATLEVVRPPPVKLEKGVPLLEAIKHVQTDITAEQAMLQSISNTPPPKDELKRQAREYVQGLAQRGRPRITVRGQSNIYGKEGLQFQFQDPLSHGGGGRSSLPYIAWLHEPAFVAALEKEIDLLALPPGMPAEKKEKELAAINASLLQLERHEERLVTLAEEQGMDVLRRPDADPRAVLSITVARPAA